ncbi:MAG: H-NS family nucleoid-associated regulatory protein [Burkholderiaceae bacterium]
MRKSNISSMSLAELQQLKSEVEAEIERRSAKTAAIEELKKMAAHSGVRLEDLMVEMGGTGKIKVKRELGPAPIRYRHPTNSALTWSGRGKRPKWVTEAMASGYSLEKLRV